MLLVRPAGIEPTTPWFVARYSNPTELRARRGHYSKTAPFRRSDDALLNTPGMLTSLATNVRRLFVFQLFVRFIQSLGFALAIAALPAHSLSLLGTVGSDETPSTLLELDPATGNTIRSIGAVGYLINGMVYEQSTGILWATTGFESPQFPNGLIKVDMTTGVGTPVGAGAGRYVALPAVSSTGELFAWSQGPASPFRLIKLDKTTGVATVVGNSGIQTNAHSLVFDNNDTLYLLNAGGDLYTINTTNAAATLVGNVANLPHGYAHHGSRNPSDGLLYALGARPIDPAPFPLLGISLVTKSVVSSVPTDPKLLTLAWVTLPASPPSSTLTVLRNGSGSGTVTSDDTFINCGATCSHTYAGGSVTLTATADAGSVFTGWLGACTGASTCTLSLTTNATVSATFASPATIAAHPLDIDANTRFDALSDGLILIRRMFGLSGTAMTAGALGGGAQRSDPAAIIAYIANLNPQFDVDGNGNVDALTDGLLTIRYLFGLRGGALVAGAIGTGATRTTSAAIETYLQSIAQ